MFRKTMILFPAALLGVLPLAASAETGDKTELDEQVLAGRNAAAQYFDGT